MASEGRRRRLGACTDAGDHTDALPVPEGRTDAFSSRSDASALSRGCSVCAPQIGQGAVHQKFTFCKRKINALSLWSTKKDNIVFWKFN